MAQYGVPKTWRCRGPGGSHRLQNGWGVARRGPRWVRLPYASAFFCSCGSFVPIGEGNGTIIGFFLGIAFSCLFLTYGPGPSSSTRVVGGRVDGEDAGRDQCGAYSITQAGVGESVCEVREIRDNWDMVTVLVKGCGGRSSRGR